MILYIIVSHLYVITCCLQSMISRGTINFLKFHPFLRIGYNLKFLGFYYYLECMVLKYLLKNFLKDFICW